MMLCYVVVNLVRKWGSRGLEFESRHSDHEKVLRSNDFRTFSFYSYEYFLCLSFYKCVGEASI